MIKLNIGCGKDIQEGFINVDIRPTGDVVGDVLELPFKDKSVDAIRAVDVFEHITHYGTQVLLNGWYSILKPGGEIFIQAPCLDRIIQFYIETGRHTLKGREMTIRLLYSDQDYPENTHLTTTIPELMQYYLFNAGFRSIEYRLDNTNAQYKAVRREYARN